MKILILLSLLSLIACGKKVVRTTTYGGNTLTVYSDGSKEWTYAPGRVPIADMDAHNEKAQAYVDYLIAASSSCDVECKVVKTDTLLGKGWVIISTDFGAGVKYSAINLDAYDSGFNNVIGPIDGEVRINRANDIIATTDGVFMLDPTSKAFLTGNYNLTTIASADGNFTLRTDNLNNAFDNLSSYKNVTQYNYNSGGLSSGAADINELGLTGITRDDFFFSEDSDSKKDLENIASNIETEELTQFGLSIKTAKLVKTLANTAGKRALTAREKDLFTKELTGLSFEKAAEMMVEDYDGLLEKAADLNETSPEAIKELINTIM